MDVLWNPFIKDSHDLLVLDTKDISPHQYEKYIKERLIKQTIPIFEPIKKNRMALLRTPIGKTVSKMKDKISTLKRCFQGSIYPVRQVVVTWKTSLLMKII